MQLHVHAGIHASPSSFLKIVPYIFFQFLQVKNQANQLNMQIELSIDIFDYEGHNP